MSDEKPPMPEQPKTAQLPAITDRALLEDLGRVVRDGFRKQETTLLEFGERIVRVEMKQDEFAEWKRDQERRATGHSGGLRRESDVNLKQDGVLTDHGERLERIEKKTDAQTAILEEVRDGAKKLLKNPVVIGLLTAAATAATAWFSARGGH